MHITKEEVVELESYRLKYVAYDWVVMWKNGRGKNAVSLSWKVFQDALLDRFFPYELR